MVLEQFKLKILILFLVMFIEIWEITVLLTVSENINVGMHSDVYVLVWYKLDVMIGLWIQHFDTRLIDHDLDSRSQECEKTTSAPIISQSFQSAWMEFCILLRLVSVMKHVLILFCPFNVQERGPYLCDFITQTLTLVHIQTFSNQFLSNLVWW